MPALVFSERFALPTQQVRLGMLAQLALRISSISQTLRSMCMQHPDVLDTFLPVELRWLMHGSTWLAHCVTLTCCAACSILSVTAPSPYLPCRAL